MKPMRLFAAVRPPPEIRREICSGLRELRKREARIRWVPGENLHLTLHFFGAVRDSEVGVLGDALDRAAAGVPAFRLELGRLGAFPALERPRVVWLGVRPQSAVLELYGAVERGLSDAGRPPPQGRFRPHITVGRAARREGTGRMHDLVEAARGVRLRGGFEVSSVDLMRSRLLPGGAEYSVVRTARLGRMG